MSSRPEIQAPPEIFYNDDEARKYTSSSRIIEIQVVFHLFCFIINYSRVIFVFIIMLIVVIVIKAKLSERALELLALPEDGVPRLLLDIGMPPSQSI